MEVVEESLLRNLDQIPYPTPIPSIHSQANTIDEEETFSIRELVHAIDTHVETDDLEVTSNLHAKEDGQGHTPTID